MPDQAPYPTKTRLALLRTVANHQVITDVTADIHLVWLFPDAPTSWFHRERVNARIAELEKAGWVECGPDLTWSVTDAGRQVLADARREERRRG